MSRAAAATAAAAQPAPVSRQRLTAQRGEAILAPEDTPFSVACVSNQVFCASGLCQCLESGLAALRRASIAALAATSGSGHRNTRPVGCRGILKAYAMTHVSSGTRSWTSNNILPSARGAALLLLALQCLLSLQVRRGMRVVGPSALTAFRRPAQPVRGGFCRIRLS